MEEMISGICFKIFQEQGVGTVSGEYRSKKIGHVVIIIEAGWYVLGVHCTIVFTFEYAQNVLQ